MSDLTFTVRMRRRADDLIGRRGGKTRLATGRVERRLAAILAADVAGYSRLMGADEEGTLSALKAIRRELADPKVKEHRGRIVKTTGDGLLVEFASVVDAVRCAVEVQQAMAERNADVPPERRIEFRMGVNLGDVIRDGRDIFGDGVNIAARLEALAEPGGICVNRVVHDQVRDKLDIAFDDLADQQVKNIARPVHVWGIRLGARPALSASEPLALPDKPSIAVLPFFNMSGDPEQEYFADGMVEEIITALSRIRWLFVIARNSSFTYKGKAVDVKRVARELGVRYLLEGSVRKAGNRVRITGQLIDTTTGAHIWGDRFDGVLDDIFELQDLVASNVAGAIEPRLRLAEIDRGRAKPTESLDAYDLYLRGVAAFRRVTQQGFEESLQFAERALEIDHGFAPAAGLAAICRVNQTSEGWVRNTPEVAAEALRLARQAIDSGRDDPDALLMAAHTIGQFAGDTKTACVAIDRALALNPNSADAWNVRGWLYLYVDQAEAAIEALERAVRLSPLDQGLYGLSLGLARAHLTAGRYDEAMAWIDKTVAEYPRYGTALRLKVVLCELMDRHDEAREWLARLREVAPDMTVEKFAAYAARHYTPRLRTLFIDALRKAGLPEE